MRRIFIILVGCLLAGVGTLAQPGNLVDGDPPNAALIRISRSDEAGLIQVEGAPGAVFPAAEVAVRNLYTGETVYVQGGITGQFSATLGGSGNTPFWISPSRNFPLDVRNEAGSVPGGPGTILYAPFPDESRRSADTITALVVDGLADDWNAYPDASAALQNRDSVYLRLPPPPEDYAMLRVELLVDETRHSFQLDPRQNVASVWRQLTVPERDLGTLGVASAVEDVLELRVPLAPFAELSFRNSISAVSLASVAYLDADGNLVGDVDDEPVPAVTVDEIDGVVYLNSTSDDVFTRFGFAGTVARGASSWRARARLDTLTLAPGETLTAEIDVTLDVPTLAPSLAGLEMIGRLSLLPVVGADGFVTSATPDGGRGWSTIQTPGGLPIAGLETVIELGEVRVPPPQVIRRGETLSFGLPVSLPVPADLPPGVYVLAFDGYAQIGDGEPFRWGENGLFGEGPRTDATRPTRTPAVLNIGRVSDDPARLLWTLFHAQPSQGSLGLLANEDRDHAALANNVRYNAPTYILPLGADVPLEPYLINMLPNAYDRNAAPLVPLLFPNGRLNAIVRRPDGTTDNLGGTPVVQNVVSTAGLDERDDFGTAAPLDVYRLGTRDAAFVSPLFDEYGEYTIELDGFVEDVWGNRYTGGGTYTFTVAEQFELSPVTLPGAPFQAGDAPHLGLHISPGVPADVTVTATLYPLDDSEPLVERVTGTANPYGVFTPSTPITFDRAGEYVIDYEARYTDDAGRLWAGSLRGAGVVAEPFGGIILHGMRGLADVPADEDPAWYNVEQIAPGGPARLYAPYHSGDVLWVPDGEVSGVQPALTAQDQAETYARWLAASHPGYTSRTGLSLPDLDVRDMLPVVSLGTDADASALIALQPATIVNNAYTYLSYVTPSVTARQVVLGDEQTRALFWDGDDPLLGQIGAGSTGMRPGDYAFLFGGAVLRNDDADLREVGIYGALSVVTAGDDARVYPPYRGAAGGPDGGPLFQRGDDTVDLFFLPRGSRPGDVLQVGDTLSVAGQVGPPLASEVAVTVTSPSGGVSAFTGQANAVGGYYDPSNDLTADEPGVWSVEVTVTHTGPSSAGERTQPPRPAATTRYNVYVVPAEADRLAWTENTTDTPIPPGSLRNFTLDVPTGWEDVTGYLTVRLPGLVVTDGEVPIQGTAVRYQLNPAALNAAYPFYEGQDGREGGPASSDPLTLTFAFTGINPEGEFDVVARQIVIRHDRLITID